VPSSAAARNAKTLTGDENATAFAAHNLFFIRLFSLKKTTHGRAAHAESFRFSVRGFISAARVC
jgi:hypothetical protein